jgi:class 3 adenylate cyclase/putative methionine-R-sulfoxide reductase with GAF domain
MVLLTRWSCCAAPVFREPHTSYYASFGITGERMKRRSKVSRERAKALRSNALKLKHRSTSTQATRITRSVATKQREIARLARELNEAREQQTGASEVLQVISSFTGELAPVFQAILVNATRICEAEHGTLFLFANGAFLPVAAHGTSAALALERLPDPIDPAPGTGLGRMLGAGAAIQIPDVLTDQDHPRDHPLRSAAERRGVRTLLCVPMIKDGDLTGAISIFRQEVRAFTDEQVELVKNFAAQAVIAIENARLLNELRQRTDDLSQRTADLTEALEQQTATSEILQVISSSPGELEPVFATMLHEAVRICDAKSGGIYRVEGDAMRLVATHNVPPQYAEARRFSPFHPGPKHILGRVMRTKSVVQIVDAAMDPGYVERRPEMVAAVELGGVGTMLGVPMLMENDLLGVFALNRQEVCPFNEKQIALLTNFAAQAVIAIENARLLNEVRQRTTDLTEALEQQTATAEVLKVISSSPGDLQPIFATMLEKAVRICDASFGNIYQWDGGALNLLASHNTPRALADLRRRSPLRPNPLGMVGHMLATKMTAHVADLAAEKDYTEQRDPGAVSGVEVGGVRTFMPVPMLKENELIGSFSLYRQEVRPFSDKQIELVTNFAAQAVIAIENARLLNELRERTDQLQAQSKELADLNQQLEQRVADQVGEIERMSRLRRFLPPQVADLIVASGSEEQLESHRREITALFCDLRGFTGFSESADPEDVMTLLREYHEAIGESIIKYSGTLERYAGDGVMVVFNDPVPVENPALQAVLMALEMRDAIGALTETWRRLGHDIGFGIGIAHGFATLGTIGFEGRFDYAAIGTVSNVASRLCDEAKPGQILISPRVLMKVENAVRVEPVGEFELKGIRRPLAAYNVVGAGS